MAVRMRGSTYESSVKSVLQGVSQQTPAARSIGHLSAQVNMLSDPVTNIRRRPGAAFKKMISWAGSTSTNILAWFTDIAGARVHILLNTATGSLKILDEDFNQEAEFNNVEYLKVAVANSIRATSVGNEFFLANTSVIPELRYDTVAINPAIAGFFYLLTGAFNKTYAVDLSINGNVVAARFTTPAGTAADDANRATPEYITDQLVTQLRAGIAASGLGATVYTDGAYVFIRHASSTIQVNSNSGSSYIIVSRSGSVQQEGDLPARLPAAANGFICRVGTSRSAEYYKYDHSGPEWIEAGAYGSPSAIANCPISITWDEDNSVWVLDTDPFEGRLSGDDDSNETHDFMKYGITGVGTYQGRLVVLAGPMVSLSASNRPRRFFRTTVTNLINSDAIEIGSGMNTSAAYEWAIPFQKELVLFSRSYQAVIPLGNTALTPSNATVVPTSAHECDTTASPVAIGRTIMYCKPRSLEYFGVLEMIPSTSTDSQYVSYDSTPHLPNYMLGRCRFATSSGVASVVLFAPSEELDTLLVHEYLWEGDNKIQQAWHKWKFQYPVATSYFASDKIVIVFSNNGVLVFCTIDPRAGVQDELGDTRPFLDMSDSVNISNNTATIPDWMLAFDPDIANHVVLSTHNGGAPRERIGATSGSTTLTTVRSWSTGEVSIGVPYKSSFTASPPILRDRTEVVIHSGKATLLRYMIGVKDSANFTVAVNDVRSTGDPWGRFTMSWASNDLALGKSLSSDQIVIIVPCRTDLRTTEMEMYTDGVGELNVISLEYILKYNQKVNRR